MNRKQIVAFGGAVLLATGAGPAPALGTRSVDVGDLNRKVDPCEDFYEFANGAWRAANPIPASMTHWSRREAGRAENQRQLQGLLQELAAKRDAPAESIEKLLGAHEASCLDTASIDAAGLKPLAPLLATLDGIRTRGDVQRGIRRLHELAIPAAFGATGGVDYHGPSNFLENLVAGGLGLPDRDLYLNPAAHADEVRTKYRAHVAKVLQLAGVPAAQATQAADDVFALEKHLAEASLDAAVAGDPAATDHKMTFAQLQQLAPHVDWATYFAEAKLPRADVNVAEPKFFQRLDKELQETPVTTWKAYLKWQLLASASPWLSKPFADEAFSFNDAYLGKATQAKPRDLLCLESTEELFGEALGRKYVERYFPPAAKAKAQEIVQGLRGVLQADVAQVAWMTPETKKKALEKLAGFNPQLGYPDRWKDLSGVKLHANTFWANIAAGRRFNVADNRKQVGHPTEHNLWLLPPFSPSAYIDFQMNEMVLPAGFLQPPAFSLEATDAVNYGALGAGFAHDMTHAIDATGADTDVLGRPVNWWTDADRKEFQKRGQCVVDQYEGYFIEPGVHHDGKRVLNEAIGDLAGVRIAFQALQASMKRHPVPVVDGFTPEQQFFLAWGQVRGEAMRLEAQRQLVKGDIHPAPKFRVVGPLSNLPEFQKAFACKAGSAMVRPPEKRCAVW